MVKFEERCDGKNKFLGVSKKGNRWQARVRDPKLKRDVYLGYYSTPEEAALAVKKKRLELGTMCKGEDCVSKKKTCGAQFKGEKLPTGVRWANGRWRVRVWDPKLKYLPSFGSYKTCEEAAIVAKRKRAELRGLVEPESEVVEKLECLNEQTGDVKVPRGVRRVKSNGKWVARIMDPMTKSRIWLGTYDTADEAISAFNKRKDLLDAKMRSAACGGSELRYVDKRDSKPNEASVKFERELGYDSPSSLLSADCMNNIAVNDEARRGVLDIPGKLGNGLVYSSPTSVLEVKNSNSAPVSDKTCDLDFDGVDSLGFINEYGQLLGRFGELDDQMWLSLPD